MKKLLGLLCVIVLAVIVTACTGKNNGETAPAKVPDKSETAKSDTVKSEKLPEVIDFYATWCGPCKALAPIMEKMEKKYAGKIRFKKVDIDQDVALAQQYEVDAVPTIVIIPVQGKSKKYVGLLPESELDSELSRIVPSETK